MFDDILISNGFIDIKRNNDVTEVASSAEHATILSNLAYYGYALDNVALEYLQNMDIVSLTEFWKTIDNTLSVITGTDKSMEKFMVYKNFPREVLDMEEGEYVIRQALIYSGTEIDYIAEKEEPRKPLGDMSILKVLKLSDDNTLDIIFGNLNKISNRWSDSQTDWANRLNAQKNRIDLTDFSFKENGIKLIAKYFDQKEIHIADGTDVLRLCAALSDADVSLREKVKFKSFKRTERKRILDILNNTKNLHEDCASRPELWKRLFERIRPGDYKFENVKSAQDSLYNKSVKSFDAQTNPQTITEDTIDVASSRPGEFVRKFHRYYGVYPQKTVDMFVAITEKLNNRQLVSFKKYINTINDRKYLMYPPKSNWWKAQIVENKKPKIVDNHIKAMVDAIDMVLSTRLTERFPEGFVVSDDVKNVKFQTNDQKLAEYGRGTVFDIPKEMTFIRSASYWEMKPENGTTWFDNGWNFFGNNWNEMGCVAWDAANYRKDSAIFSGDPVNTNDMKGRGCQMIDLYIDKLVAAGVRYAVWNILCYSKIKFSDANDVLATLQMGENAITGKQYEPSRAQIVFPLKSPSLSSYVAYIDLVERKLVYMDAGFKADVRSASSNNMGENMKAYVEYLNSIPSVYDMLETAPKGIIPAMYSDENVPIDSEKAFVFKKSNSDNSFNSISLIEMIDG